VTGELSTTIGSTGLGDGDEDIGARAGDGQADQTIGGSSCLLFIGRAAVLIDLLNRSSINRSTMLNTILLVSSEGPMLAALISGDAVEIFLGKC
jgi:hypothetical protein